MEEHTIPPEASVPETPVQEPILSSEPPPADEPEKDLVFGTQNREILRFCPNGDIYHEERKIKNAAKHVYKGIITWLTNQEQVFPAIKQRMDEINNENFAYREEIDRLSDENVRLQKALDQFKACENSKPFKPLETSCDT